MGVKYQRILQESSRELLHIQIEIQRERYKLKTFQQMFWLFSVFGSNFWDFVATVIQPSELLSKYWTGSKQKWLQKQSCAALFSLFKTLQYFFQEVLGIHRATDNNRDKSNSKPKLLGWLLNPDVVRTVNF